MTRQTRKRLMDRKIVELRKEGVSQAKGKGRSPDSYRFPFSPYGYRVTKGRVEICARAMRTVRLIVELRGRQSLSFGKVARCLKEKGYRTRLDAEWTSAGVRIVFLKWRDKISAGARLPDLAMIELELRIRYELADIYDSSAAGPIIYKWKKPSVRQNSFSKPTFANCWRPHQTAAGLPQSSIGDGGSNPRDFPHTRGRSANQAGIEDCFLSFPH